MEEEEGNVLSRMEGVGESASRGTKASAVGREWRDALRDKMGSHSPVAFFLLCVKFHPIYHVATIYHVAIVKTYVFSNSA